MSYTIGERLDVAMALIGRIMTLSASAIVVAVVILTITGLILHLMDKRRY